MMTHTRAAEFILLLLLQLENMVAIELNGRWKEQVDLCCWLLGMVSFIVSRPFPRLIHSDVIVCC